MRLAKITWKNYSYFNTVKDTGFRFHKDVSAYIKSGWIRQFVYWGIQRFGVLIKNGQQTVDRILLQTTTVITSTGKHKILEDTNRISPWFLKPSPLRSSTRKIEKCKDQKPRTPLSLTSDYTEFISTKFVFKTHISYDGSEKREVYAPHPWEISFLEIWRYIDVCKTYKWNWVLGDMETNMSIFLYAPKSIFAAFEMWSEY